MFVEIGVWAEVKGSLAFPVLDVEAGPFGDEEYGNGGTTLLLCTAGHDGLGYNKAKSYKVPLNHMVSQVYNMYM